MPMSEGAIYLHRLLAFKQQKHYGQKYIIIILE